MNYDLSVIIPARREMFLARTVESILKAKNKCTEIIVVLDGEWSDPPITDHPDLTILYFGESIGQRAATNQGVRLSKAKYVMKIDAHCEIDKDFDIKMMSEMKDNYTMIPTMYNLHAFDWLCTKCKHRIYQGPTPKECPECKGPMVRDMIWKPRMSRKSEFYRFDTTLHFQYHGQRKKNVSPSDILVETQSAQGSCFMLTRDKYWELNISDEAHGSWGQQGTEIACKTWLSGGRLVTNRKTWYSHMFRTQGGDFGFPYPQSGRQVDNARKYSRKLFLENTFEKQIYPLSWLLEKFRPLPDWHDPSGKDALEKVMKAGDDWYSKHPERNPDLFYYEEKKDMSTLGGNKLPTKAIITYTDNAIDETLAKACQKQMMKAGLPIYNVSLKPMDFGTKNIVFNAERGYLTFFKQVVAGLEAATEDIVFMCDHDLLYHPSHFDFIPSEKDVFYYNLNIWRVRATDGYAIHYDAKQSNMLVGYRELMLDNYRRRIAWVEKNGWSTILGFEPGTQKRVPEFNSDRSDTYMSEYPSLDIRHGKNLTRSKWKPTDFRNGIRSCPNWVESDSVKGWGLLKDNFNNLLKSI